MGFFKDIKGENAAPGVVRKVLAYCDAMMCVVKEITKGDSLCKQNGVKHGCVCLEKGVLVDIFTPMREDFIL